jgi:hypothetical protein
MWCQPTFFSLPPSDQSGVFAMRRLAWRGRGRRWKIAPLSRVWTFSIPSGQNRKRIFPSAEVDGGSASPHDRPFNITILQSRAQSSGGSPHDVFAGLGFLYFICWLEAVGFVNRDSRSGVPTNSLNLVFFVCGSGFWADPASGPRRRCGRRAAMPGVAGELDGPLDAVAGAFPWLSQASRIPYGPISPSDTPPSVLGRMRLIVCLVIAMSARPSYALRLPAAIPTSVPSWPVRRRDLSKALAYPPTSFSANFPALGINPRAACPLSIISCRRLSHAARASRSPDTLAPHLLDPDRLVNRPAPASVPLCVI